MTPLVETAESTPSLPLGANPPAPKFEPWKCVAASTMMTNTGTASFHQVAAELVCASQRTPRKLITVNRAISPIATSRPCQVSVPLSFCSQVRCTEAYLMVAYTSIGATATAWR